MKGRNIVSLGQPSFNKEALLWILAPHMLLHFAESVFFLILFEEDVVLVLGSDGIFDVLSDAEVGGRGGFRWFSHGLD